MPEGLPPALACLVGYLGYETIGLVETLPRAADSPLDLPDMLFVRPTVILVFDGLTNGIASSLSRAIVYGEDLGESLRNVALGVADAFIAAFIKIQTGTATDAAATITGVLKAF